MESQPFESVFIKEVDVPNGEVNTGAVSFGFERNKTMDNEQEVSSRENSDYESSLENGSSQIVNGRNYEAVYIKQEVVDLDADYKSDFEDDLDVKGENIEPDLVKQKVQDVPTTNYKFGLESYSSHIGKENCEAENSPFSSAVLTKNSTLVTTKSKCSLCNFSTKHSWLLSEHLSLHNNSKNNFTCYHCGYLFQTRDQIRHHMILHLKDLALDDNFKKNESFVLRNHIAAPHTGDKNLCLSNACSNALHSPQKRRYSCKFCSYTGNFPSAMRRHYLLHVDEKPYKCGLCDYTCRSTSTLKTHEIKHTGELRRACRLCDFRTRYSSTLKRHMFKHSGGKPLMLDL